MTPSHRDAAVMWTKWGLKWSNYLNVPKNLSFDSLPAPEIFIFLSIFYRMFVKLFFIPMIQKLFQNFRNNSSKILVKLFKVSKIVPVLSSINTTESDKKFVVRQRLQRAPREYVNVSKCDRMTIQIWVFPPIVNAKREAEPVEQYSLSEARIRDFSWKPSMIHAVWRWLLLL